MNKRRYGRGEDRGPSTAVRLGAAALLWAVSLVLWQAACRVDGFAEWYAVNVYPLLVNTVGRLFSLLPFSMAEMILYSGAAAIVLWVILRFRRGFHRYDGAGVLLLGGTLMLVFQLGCGINYHRLTFSQREGLEAVDVTREELELFCEAMVQQVNEAAGFIDTYEEGWCRIISGIEEDARDSVKKLGETYVSLDGYYPLPKPVLFSLGLSVQQVTGIYSPFTMEANYNRLVPDYEKAFTVCHELSHLKGFMREDEANFVAWLACENSDRAEFRYSGALMGFIYAGNALYRYDKDRYLEIRGQLCDGAKADLSYGSAYWNQYRGKAAEVHEKVNNAYLKANSQTDGVESYGHVVDLMLAYARTAD